MLWAGAVSCLVEQRRVGGGRGGVFFFFGGGGGGVLGGGGGGVVGGGGGGGGGGVGGGGGCGDGGRRYERIEYGKPGRAFIEVGARRAVHLPNAARQGTASAAELLNLTSHEG